MEEEKKEAQNPEEVEEEQVDTAEAAKTEETPEEAVKEEETPEEEEVEAEPEEEVKAGSKEEEIPTPAEEEEKAEAPTREKKEKEEEIVEERIYTVPLSKAWIMPPRKRAPRAMRMLRSFMVKHMKLEAHKEAEGEEEEEPKNLVISNEVNERIWGRGIEKPPRKIRVRAAVDKDGNVTVYLAEGD
jgi:large subunit ribosomal protein L31e